ncbi:glycosyltransferase family 4 protein [uncultured Rikenella sp.]|uniref:glycosyltransferase family 4 protein n=1 Tax=uncultured Rikenella sp. TaxID=368003 RepID=UPI00262CC841|nr:glycosyltransferase family 4 protein [uncultured Rikenella sp.]
MRIIYHTFDLNGSGGMERVLVQKANWLAEHGYQVEILTTEEDHCEPFFPLHSQVCATALNINYNRLYKSDNVWRNIIESIRKRQLHKRKLKAYLREHPCDIFITLQHRNFIPKLKDGSRKIFEVHFSTAAKREFLQRLSRLYRLAYRLGTWWQERTIKYYDRFVVLTEADRRERALNNCVAIPNSITIPIPDQTAALTNKRVICVARYSYQKGLDFLIPAWRIVVERHPDWRLDIFGRTYGREKEYTDLLRQNGVETSVRLCEPTQNIVSEYQNSSIYVLSSRYEGFPLVLGEAMACGVPCVSYACPFGPEDIIRDGVDGIIVPQVGNIPGLAAGICRLIENESLRQAMGIASREGVQRYEEKNVMPLWVDLFHQLVHQ